MYVVISGLQYMLTARSGILTPVAHIVRSSA